MPVDGSTFEWLNLFIPIWCHFPVFAGLSFILPYNWDVETGGFDKTHKDFKDIIINFLHVDFIRTLDCYMPTALLIPGPLFSTPTFHHMSVSSIDASFHPSSFLFLPSFSSCSIVLSQVIQIGSCLECSSAWWQTPAALTIAIMSGLTMKWLIMETVEIYMMVCNINIFHFPYLIFYYNCCFGKSCFAIVNITTYNNQ